MQTDNNTPQKKRETFSVPLKIPGQTSILSAALQQYRSELQLDNDSSKSDFFLFLMRRYLKVAINKKIKELEAANNELTAANKRFKEQTASSKKEDEAANSKLLVANKQLSEEVESLRQQLELAANKVILDMAIDDMQEFERVVQRRLTSNESDSRENFICQLLRFAKKNLDDKSLHD